MYRTAARRLLHGLSWGSNARLRFFHLPTIINSSHFSTSTDSQSFSNQIPNDQHQHPQIPPEIPTYADFASSSTVEEAHRHESQSSGEGVGRRPRVEYQDEQALVLQASLRHVIRLGWTQAALIAGARELGVSPSIIGSFPRKEATLVEFFMDECLQRLIDRIDSEEELKNLIPSERISKLVRIRLEMQAPYISKWPQALSIQAQPLNVPTSFMKRAMLVDEIWHAVGDEASEVDWYVKCTILGGIYSTTEVFMLTDSSPVDISNWHVHLMGLPSNPGG